MSQKLAVVVTGATGQQGGAVVKNLLGRGHEVRAITRNIDSAKARALAYAGATLVRASLEDTAALTKALEGATSLFAMTTPFEGGPQAKTRQGIFAADAAKAAGVHLVFNSVGSANRQTGVPHFDSKYEVEKHIAKIGVRATVPAPVYFMENLYFGKEQLAKGIYATPLPPTKQLAQVAVADIGAVAVRLLEAPGRFSGKRFDLGGDELTGNDVVAILSRVTGRPFTYFRVPLDVIRQRMGEDGAKMYEWFDHIGFTFDRAALRREFPDVSFHDFESWAKSQDWNTLLQGT
ncbi:NmrA/HSCARG family protein [Rhizobium lusitanum]|uniref:NmrA/HSCARG family protein n=1 Tax=Rhizobium lusitanum TaxID=293958 RepID=UPI001959A0FF|nr:NmrA/HSCARG family protein [Rhizobium lusitanum]MBM7045770.1 NmrA/HSCARG family protein [Rhizobium lusitanum]